MQLETADRTTLSQFAWDAEELARMAAGQPGSRAIWSSMDSSLSKDEGWAVGGCQKCVWKINEIFATRFWYFCLTEAKWENAIFRIAPANDMDMDVAVDMAVWRGEEGGEGDRMLSNNTAYQLNVLPLPGTQAHTHTHTDWLGKRENWLGKMQRDRQSENRTDAHNNFYNLQQCVFNLNR